MKNYLLKVICLMALSIAVLPIVANDYLKIYFKDGHTARHYMELVESISATKYDLEGNLHSDYQMQQIVMKDTTYSYYFADIDSMSFTKVYEEQLKEDVEAVSNSVTPVFEQCSTVEEMEDHIDEIKNMQGVEDVWREGTDIVVQIRDWHKVYFTYIEPPKTRYSNNKSRLLNAHSIKRKLPLKEDGTPIKVAIAFQMNGDSRFADAKELDIDLKDRFLQMGFDAHFIPDESTGEILDIDFYERRMFDYDIVFIDTHGGYSGGKHSFFTSVKPGFWYEIGEDIEDIFDIDDISYGTCRTGEGLLNFGNFKIVSEDFIRKSNYKFTGSGPHIVFSGACKTFQGKETLTIEHNGREQEIEGCSNSVANIFFGKGADICLGYNESTSYSSDAAYDLFSNMLNGASQETAFYLLDANLKKEEKSYLIDLINPNSIYDNPKSIFLFKNQTVGKTQQEIDDDFINNGRIDLKGITSVFDLNHNTTGLRYGFRLGIAPHVENQNENQNTYAKEKGYSEEEQYQVVFSANAFADPGTTVYYRAFTYDGIHYNWGEEKSFTITQLQVSSNYLSLEAGWTQTIDITSGFGDYEVKSDNESVATVSVFENTISINALTAGDATITVKDKSGQTTTIMVEVTASSDIVAHTTCPDANHPHMIDLGLPSGTKWSCCNVGASTPESYGGYFAWGETSGKSVYDWYSYQYSDSYANCEHIGDNIAGTEYDVATAAWGSSWKMPTLEQFQELFDNTTPIWFTQNGVDGRLFTSSNGGFIFLPAAGNHADADLNGDGERGYYWSSSLKTGKERYAWGINFSETKQTTYDFGRYYGLSVRPVAK